MMNTSRIGIQRDRTISSCPVLAVLTPGVCHDDGGSAESKCMTSLGNLSILQGRFHVRVWPLLRAMFIEVAENPIVVLVALC